jgi:acetyltransferase-like isoleucine patch superfamily enzyme
MNWRLLGGDLVALIFNQGVGRFPSSALRRLFLRRWLGAFGPGTSVQIDCHFMNGRRIHFGARNVINFGCLFDGRIYSIRTGDNVSIGPEAAILNLGHDPNTPDFANRGGDVVIGSRAWIGYRALILPGVTIGEGAVVGAGAVVTKNVEPFTIVAGNPARKIGERNRNLVYELDFDTIF